MKRLFITAILIPALTTGLISGDFSVNLNINYNNGIGDFFQASQLHLSYSGLNFIEKKQNRMGLGFNLTVDVPIMKRFYVVPGIAMFFGHQQYEYSQIDPGSSSENDAKDTYYFKIYSGELNLQYDLLALKNGWFFSVILGLNYNHFQPDNEMRSAEKKYWGAQTGIAARFLLLKHLGFQAAFLYLSPFDTDFPSFVSGQAGISYRF